MFRSRVRSPAAVTGIVLIVIGIVLALCSLPIFTFMQDAMREIPKYETIMNYSFNIHESQDKIVQFQMNIGQKLNVLATGNNYFNFSISNFTTTDQPIQADQADVVLYPQLKGQVPRGPQMQRIPAFPPFQNHIFSPGKYRDRKLRWARQRRSHAEGLLWQRCRRL